MLTMLWRGLSTSTSASTGRSRGGVPEVSIMIEGCSLGASRACWNPSANPVRIAPVALRRRHASSLGGRAEDGGTA